MAKLLDDDYLKPFETAIRGRAMNAFARANQLTGGKTSLADWASAHEYYGLHRTRRGWVFREWAPHATSMWLVGDFSKWCTDRAYECMRLPGTDVWELKLPAKAIKAGDNYRLEMRWEGGRGERIPAYARYVVQDPDTKLFCAQVYESNYKWRHRTPKGAKHPCIYEAHVGMGGEEERVHTYAEFRDEVLPRVKKAGYDTVQLMAIMEIGRAHV